MAVSPPRHLRVLSQSGLIEVDWFEGPPSQLPFRLVRQNCPCAGCVNEFTGERILVPDSVPVDVRPLQVDFAGNYGLKVAWSDGHHSGIFTWERLELISRLTTDPSR